MLVASQRHVSQLQKDSQLEYIKMCYSSAIIISFGPAIRVAKMRQASKILINRVLEWVPLGGNTKRGSITVPLTSCLTGLD